MSYPHILFVCPLHVFYICYYYPRSALTFTEAGHCICTLHNLVSMGSIFFEIQYEEK